MPEQSQPLDTWAIVEVMGHKKFAGYVTEQTIGGAALIRVDVPETTQPNEILTKAYSKLIGVGSIYCITPCTEEVARACAQQIERWNDPIPVDLPKPRLIPASVGVASDADVIDTDDDDSWGSDSDDEDDGF